MSVAEKSDVVLWARVVEDVREGSVAGAPNTWNARKAQLAVKLYKSRGGKYRSRKSRKNSLRQWTDEDWGYIDDKPGNRYLPKDVRKSLSRGEKMAENRRKKSASRAGKSRASYSKSVAAKLRKSRKSHGLRTSHNHNYN
jgi:hypothetical protein